MVHLVQNNCCLWVASSTHVLMTIHLYVTFICLILINLIKIIFFFRDIMVDMLYTNRNRYANKATMSHIHPWSFIAIRLIYCTDLNILQSLKSVHRNVETCFPSAHQNAEKFVSFVALNITSNVVMFLSPCRGALVFWSPSHSDTTWSNKPKKS